MLNCFRVQLQLAPLSLGVFLLLGCGGGPSGPALAPVQGTVTLDGQPVAKARVEFIPSEGRPSTAITGTDGTYNLAYSPTENGAIIGATYRVTIQTARDAVESEGQIIEPKVTETIPERYHKNTELTAVIESGTNTINFELKSK